MVIKEHKIFVAFTMFLYWKQAYFQGFEGTYTERAIAPPNSTPLVMGQRHIKSIQTLGQTSGNTVIMAIKEHKISVAISESLSQSHV